MKIWVLAENTACREDLAAEHGLSLYIETGNRRILFDMGQSSAFLKNAETLKLSLSQVDIAVLSHGHYDHGGGLEAFLAENSRAKIYVNQYAFEPHFHGPEKYIGLPPELSQNPRLTFTRETAVIAPGILLYPQCPQLFPLDPGGLEVLEDGRRKPEDFRHEQYLLVEENGKRILFSGCSHRGIRSIAAFFQPDILIGGFHLMKGEDPRILEETARTLLALPTRYYTGHCTGQAAFAFLKERMGDRLQPFSTGTVLEI